MIEGIFGWLGAFATLLVGSGMGTAVVTYILETRKEREQHRQAWKKEIYDELLGPLMMHFGRSKQAFMRYDQTRRAIEATVLQYAM